MKPFRNILTFIILIIFSFNSASAITGNQALEKFRNRMKNISRLTGIITWTSEDDQNSTASFKYMSPGKIYLKFSNPKGKTIVSNGKRLWIYDSNSNICGIQDLGTENSGGIASLTNGYLAIVTSQSSKGYTLKLKNNDKTYSQVTLMLDSTFFLKKAILKNKDGGSIIFSLSNINMSAGVLKSLFEFTVPANAQTVINPLNIR